MCASYLNSVMDPPIVEVNKRISLLKESGKEIINLGQAVVDFFPNEKIKKTIEHGFDNISFHYYSPDSGFYSLRKKICGYLEKHYGAQIDPSEEIFITSGANQAYYIALMSILAPGDEVVIPTPYYFNHVMATRMLHGVPKLVHLRDDNGFRPDLEEIKKAVTDKTKALTLVSPNNPTGMVYDMEEMEKIIAYCADKGIFVLVDETYQVYHFKNPISVTSLFDKYDNLFVMSSFSKSHGFAGWRLGYLCFPRELNSILYKIQDTIVISPPTVSQVALESVFDDSCKEIEENKKELYRRGRLVFNELKKTSPDSHEPEGGCFFWFSIPGINNNCESLAFDLMEKKGVAVVPGVYFGKEFHSYWRISFGSAPEVKLKKGCRLIKEFIGDVL